MTEPAFLAHLPDPFSVQEPAFCLLRPDGQARRIDAGEVSAFDGRLITYDMPALVDELRRLQRTPPTQLIEIGEALRLVAGTPRDEGGERRWDVWRHLARHFRELSTAKTFEAVAKSRIARPSEPKLSDMLCEAAGALASLWSHTETQLRERGEFDRFVAVEAPVQAIFAHRASAGIAVDREMAGVLLNVLLEEKYEAFQRVATVLSTNPTGLNFWNIGPRLRDTDAAHLAEIDDGGRLRDAFKIASFQSTFARDFLQLVEATQDEVVLRRASGLEERIHPTFAISGTVSSRILVSDPFIQQLRRRYRGIIAPDPGKRLVYLDYAQFEPGILAFLSGDRHLIDAYAEGDLYTALSRQVFGTGEMRPTAKRMFLAFCYGMTSEGIARLVARAGDQNDLETRRQAVEAFFASFPGLMESRASMEEGLARNGYASSLMGNRRWRTISGALTHKEKRWAVNQPVQATASLIFKEALIALANRFGNNSILLPMHDAVLMQFVADEGFEEKRSEAEALMLNAFYVRCPGIAPRVTAGPFAG